MPLAESLRVALDSLRANRLRSALTMLGMIIGVTAVIILMAVGAGAASYVDTALEQVGSTLIFVAPGNANASAGFNFLGRQLTLSDVHALADTQNVPDAARVAQDLYGPIAMTVGAHQWNTYIDGTTPDFASMRGYHLAGGTSFTADQYAASARVVVLGPTPAKHLFPDSDPLGQQVRLNGVPFTVIGLYAPKGGSTLTNDDDTATVPYSTARADLLGTSQTLAILVDARSKAAVDLTVAEVRSVLEARHGITDPAKDDFNITTTSSFITLANQFTGIFTIVIAAIAAISLVVGGIGIMNILLVSVTERTREIGIRKAIGARRSDIVQQFLLESVMLSVLGGLVGVVLGGSLSTLIGLFAPLKPSVSLPSVLLAFGVSVAVGLFFGVWPASRAARLRPVEALRHE